MTGLIMAAARETYRYFNMQTQGLMRTHLRHRAIGPQFESDPITGLTFDIPVQISTCQGMIPHIG